MAVVDNMYESGTISPDLTGEDLNGDIPNPAEDAFVEHLLELSGAPYLKSGTYNPETGEATVDEDVEEFDEVEKAKASFTVKDWRAIHSLVRKHALTADEATKAFIKLGKMAKVRLVKRSSDEAVEAFLAKEPKEPDGVIRNKHGLPKRVVSKE